MLRVVAYIIGIPLLLLLLAVVLVPLLVDEQRLVTMAADAMEERSGARITVHGDAGLALFPRVALNLGDTEVNLPNPGQPEITVGTLAVEVRLWPLFTGEVAITGIDLSNLEITVPAAEVPATPENRSLTDAELDRFFEARRRARREAAESAAGGALALPMALNIQRLQISDARITLLQAAGAEPVIVEIDSLNARDLNLDGEPVPLSLRLRVAGEPVVLLDLDATFSVDGEQQQLMLREADAELSGATPRPLQLQANGTVDLETRKADLELVLRSGDMRGNGSLRYTGFESPQIDAILQLNLLDPALLLLAGPEAAAAEPGETDSGADTGDAPLPLEALRLADTRADIRVDRAIIEPHTITDLHLQLRALEGVVTLDTITGALHGGQLDATATLNARRSIAQLDTRGEFKGLDTAQLLAALDADPVLTGNASANWELTSAGRTRNELVQELLGEMQLTTADVVLQQMGIERMLCEVVAQVNQESLQAELPARSEFETLTATIKLAEGEALLAPLRAELAHVALRGDGRLDLATTEFRADFRAQLGSGLAEVDPACRVNERITSIAWPVVCKGELGGEPGDWCRVDSREILQALAKGELERKVKKEGGKLLQKLLDRTQPKEEEQ